MSMTNALLLRPGDRLPDFALAGLDGKLRKFIWSFTGEPVVLIAIDDIRNLDGEQFAALAARAQRRLGRAGRGRRQRRRRRRRPVAKLGGDAEGRLLLCDPERKFVGPCWPRRRSASARRRPAHARDRARSQPARRRHLRQPRPAAAAEAIRASPIACAAMAAPTRDCRRRWRRCWCCRASSSPISAPSHPLWGKGDHKDSGVSSRYGNVNLLDLKRTEDYTIVEPMMLKAVSDRLAYRIGPELTKVFAYDREFTFDSHVVLSYSAEGRHFFGAHRDNGAPTTARPLLRGVAQPQRRFRGRRTGLSRNMPASA
jgi:hypothetical protein